MGQGESGLGWNTKGGGSKSQPSLFDEKVAPSGYVWAKDFPEGKLKQHFSDHAKDFGIKSKSEYNEKAKEFMNSQEDEFTDSFVAKNGTVYKYDSKTNTFGMMKSDGTMITFYKPDDKEKYWEDQVEKYYEN